MERTSKRVAIYARVSSASQARRDLSVPEQEREVREFCLVRGWTVVEVFKDEGRSGADTVNRPAFLRMVRAACSGSHPFDLILTRDQSRFGRGTGDAAQKERLRKHGVAIDNVQSATGDMDAPLTPDGEMIETITLATDIRARKTTTIHMIASQKAKARKGGLSGAQATGYGFKQEWLSEKGGRPTRKPIIDKPKAKIVREMFRRYIRGDSLLKITRWLNDTGFDAPRGTEWYESTVRKILSNEAYLGRLVHGGIKKTTHPVTGTRVNTKNTGEVIRVDNAFPAIVDQVTFDKVQAILGRNESTRPQGGHPRHTLRGIGRCKVCSWYLAHQRKPRDSRFYYLCGNRKENGADGTSPECKGNLPAEYVDEVVALFLRRVLSTSVTDIRAQVAKYNAAASNLTGLSATEDLDTAISEHERKVKNLVHGVANVKASPALLKTLDEAEEKLAELRGKRDAAVTASHIPTVDVQSVLDARAGIKDALRDGDTEQMRALLSAIVSEVRCDWSKRHKPAVSFSYLFERDEEAEPGRKLTAGETAIVERILGPGAVKRNGSPRRYRVSIKAAGAPLTFIPKWSITNAERAAEEALQQIAEALE